MTRSDEFISQVERYLDEYEGNTPLPESVRNAVRAELPTTRQRPAWWPARRSRNMNSFAKFGVAAAVVVIAALLGFNYLVAPNVGGPGPEESSPTATPTPAALDGQDPLSAGRYQADPALPMVVTVDVPDGWSAGGAWVLMGPNGNDTPEGMAIRFYTADFIYSDPLVPEDGELQPAVGPSADDLVAAIEGHPDWSVTGTDPVTIGGYPGQVVHVTLPGQTSNDTPFYLFGDDGGGQVWGWAPDQAFDIYIVDVAGERLIIDAFHFSDTSDADIAAQQSVLSSIQIDPNP